MSFVAALTWIYHKRPYRPFGDPKPTFVFMPKYEIDFDDYDALTDRLLSEGFSRAGSSNRYRSRFSLGNFSSRLMRLVVDLDEPNKRAFLKGGSWVILFDTGDLWKVASALKGQA